MRYLIVSLLLLFPNLVSSISNSRPRQELTTREKIDKLNTLLPEREVASIARMIDESAKKYKINSDIFISIIKTESNFSQSVVSPTGDISMAQINVKVWNREFKRLKKQAIDQKKLKKSPLYAIQTMGQILNILKHRYAKKDPKWYARYHSNTEKYKTIYLSKLTQHNKLLASNVTLIR